MSIMIRQIVFLGIFILLGGCYFDYPLTGAIQDIDPALAGEWRDSTGEITVVVQSVGDEYRLRYTDDHATYLFDTAVILEIAGDYFLQARFFGEEQADGTLDDSPKEPPWLVLAIEIEGDRIIVRVPDTGEKFVPRELKNAQEYRSAFAAALRRDGFLGPPMTFRKILP
ncbi:MAG: hypothetical protein V3R56_07570 [Xanthomonadales bacterium]